MSIKYTMQKDSIFYILFTWKIKPTVKKCPDTRLNELRDPCSQEIFGTFSFFFVTVKLPENWHKILRALIYGRIIR